MGVDFPAGFCYNAGKLSFYLSEALLLQYLTNLWNALDFGSLESILLRVASVFLCLTIHETCHGLAAYALGDPTAKRAHRLSLNPLRHIDWLGLIMMVAAGFGWAKPVPVDPSYFKKPKQGMALTALAGPVSNFVLALLALRVPAGGDHGELQRYMVFLPGGYGIAVGGPGAVQPGAYPTAGRLKGAGGAAAGPGVQLAHAL